MAKNKQMLKKNLLQSLKKESDSVDKRFARADSIILNRTTNKNKVTEEKVIKCTFTIHKEVIENIDKIIINSAKLGYIVNKSEIVRIALNNLYRLSMADNKLFDKIIKEYK